MYVQAHHFSYLSWGLYNLGSKNVQDFICSLKKVASILSQTSQTFKLLAKKDICANGKQLFIWRPYLLIYLVLQFGRAGVLIINSNYCFSIKYNNHGTVQFSYEKISIKISCKITCIIKETNKGKTMNIYNCMNAFHLVT